MTMFCSTASCSAACVTFTERPHSANTGAASPSTRCPAGACVGVDGSAALAASVVTSAVTTPSAAPRLAATSTPGRCGEYGLSDTSILATLAGAGDRDV
jgi:hypothetical protein